MPLYEYECDACGHHFELIRKFSDPPLEKCPKCGGQVRKLISSPAFHLKGTGWYVTDYAKKDNAGGAKGEDTGSSKESDSSGSGKDAKDAKDTKDTGTKSESASPPAAAPASAPAKGSAKD